MYARYVHNEQHIVCFAIADQGLCAAKYPTERHICCESDVRRARNGWNTSLAEKGTLVLLVFQ